MKAILLAAIYGCALLSALLGCGESASPLATAKPDSSGIVQHPGSADSGSILDEWLLPWDSATADSELIGDFSPIAEGTQWIYHEFATLNTPPGDSVDRQLVNRVKVEALKMRPSDSGRMIQVRIEITPIRVQCSLIRYGKRWDWDELPADGAIARKEQTYLERGDAFLVSDGDGKWRRTQSGCVFLYHRYWKAKIGMDPELPTPDAMLRTTSDYGVGAVYVRGLGLFAMDSTGPSGNKVKMTAWRLVSFNGSLENDSLEKDFKRTLVPKDPETGSLIPQDILPFLPKGFCDDAPGAVPLAGTDVSAFTDLRSGNRWEYLYTRSGSTMDKYNHAWWSQAGWSGIRLDQFFASGGCTLYFLDETDSLFAGKSISQGNGMPKPDTTIVLSEVESFHSLVLKKGTRFYRCDRQGAAVTLDSARVPGTEGDGSWPFTSGITTLTVGHSEYSPAPFKLDSLSFDSIGSSSYLVYWESFSDAAPNHPWKSKMAKGLGLVYAQSSMPALWPGLPSNGFQLELFRYNGAIIDPDVFERFKNLIR